MHDSPPVVRTSPHNSAQFVNWLQRRCGPKRGFPTLSRGERTSAGTYGDQPQARKSKGNVTVLSSRAKTGFGGMITITVVLLVMQFITGAQAFPL
jgi:hypothetical protein